MFEPKEKKKIVFFFVFSVSWFKIIECFDFGFFNLYAVLKAKKKFHSKYFDWKSSAFMNFELLFFFF